MIAPLVGGLLLVPLADQLVKRLVRRRVGSGSFSLGVFGQVRLVEARVWAVRLVPWASPASLWVVWVAAAAASAFLSAALPGIAWPLGLVLGGALSHLLETTFRGSVSDYVCLRFWPAFNLADVALAVGATGCAMVLVSGGV